MGSRAEDCAIGSKTFPAFTWNVATGFDLDLTVQSFVNDDGEAWRTQGNAMYLRMRWSY